MSGLLERLSGVATLPCGGLSRPPRRWPPTYFIKEGIERFKDDRLVLCFCALTHEAPPDQLDSIFTGDLMLDDDFSPFGVEEEHSERRCVARPHGLDAPSTSLDESLK